MHPGFHVIVKMAVAVERFLHVQEIFCEVLLEENEVIKNDSISFAAVIDDDCLLFLSKKAMFLTARDSNVNRPKMKTGLCPHYALFFDVVATIVRRLSKQNIVVDK